MDQNNGEQATPDRSNFRQSSSQPIARQAFNVPVNRPFAVSPPVAPTPLPQPNPTSPVEPIATQQFSAPAPTTAPVIQAAPSIGYQAPVPAAPLTFQPRRAERIRRPLPTPGRVLVAGKRKVASMSRRGQVVAALLAIVVIGGGIAAGNSTLNGSSEGVSAHGRKIAVSEPTVSDHTLESSCYSLSLPSNYALTHTNGCVNDINLPHGTSQTLISVASNPTTTAFSLKDAPLALEQQLKVIGKVSNYQTSPTKVNGLDALKVTYQLSGSPVQALVYIPSPPAKYLSGTQAVGAFVVRGYYSTDAQKSTFDSTVSSLHWVR